jgi:hypothetical protein
MGSPFNPGRDSSAGPSSDMFNDPTPGDLNSAVGDQFAKGYDYTHSNLAEVDYRDAENKP